MQGGIYLNNLKLGKKEIDLAEQNMLFIWHFTTSAKNAQHFNEILCFCFFFNCINLLLIIFSFFSC